MRFCFTGRGLIKAWGKMMTTQSVTYLRDQRFFVRLSAILAAFIVFSFAQYAARGYVDIPHAPWWMHVHGVLMVSWLGIFVTQNVLAANGNLALHRKLGWIATCMVVVIVALGALMITDVLQHKMVPFFFTPAMFAVQNVFNFITFAALVFTGVYFRRQVQYHRRFMIAAVVILTGPALGRILPMPLLGVWGEPVQILIDLGIFGVLALHDRRIFGHVHRATKTGVAVLLGIHVAGAFAALNPGVIALVDRIAAS